jgi:hypothetical protein
MAKQKHFYAVTLSPLGELHEYCDKPYKSAKAAIRAIEKHRTWMSVGAKAEAVSLAKLRQLKKNLNCPCYSF